MRVAVPLFGTRVSPRCLYSDKTLLIHLVDNRQVSRQIVDTTGMTEEERLSQLVDMEIDLFVCGAIDREFVDKTDSYGIRVIHDVAGEVVEILSALTSGNLKSGYGLANFTVESGTQNKDDATDFESDRLDEGQEGGLKIDCIDCIDRMCLKGANCIAEHGDFFPADKYSRFHRSMEITADIMAETDRKLCRVAEFIYYCLGMEYKHVGIAFCVEMFREAEILTHLLRRFFKVSPVCCKIGGRAQHDLVTAADGVLCNPIGQARVLKSLKTDINVVAGLCIGVDFIFSQHSEVPTSTLFVKDKSLANNPVSALYSKYYIDDILGEN